MTLDHLKLAQSDPAEVARLREWLSDPEPDILHVLHRPGNICCMREPWSKTYARIVAAVNPPYDCATLDIDMREP